MNNVGLLYRSGLGGPQNPTEAAKWFGRAASAGEPAALMYLAEMYDEGEGVARTPSRAADLVVRAIDAGVIVEESAIASLSRETITRLQYRLYLAGLYIGRFDGIIGPATRAALARYAERN